MGFFSTHHDFLKTRMVEQIFLFFSEKTEKDFLFNRTRSM